MTGQSADQEGQLLDEVFEALERHPEVVDDAKYVLLSALQGDAELAAALDETDFPEILPSRDDKEAPATEPVGAFLRSITVRGFRGVGPETTLELHPAPGLTVIAGRNGSGKSSFSEALELAITGTTYRWREKKSVVWADEWRNLHDGDHCKIAVELAEESVGSTTLGVSWGAGAGREKFTTWVQRPGQRRQPGADSLGWSQAVDVFRPILSYDELGGLLASTPSTLFDRINAVLGLDRFAEGQTRLAGAEKRLKDSGKVAAAAAKMLKEELTGMTDERAVAALAALRRRPADREAVRALATGAASRPTSELATLKTLTTLPIPTAEAVAATATALWDTNQALLATSTAAAEDAEQGMELLRQALDYHGQHGDGMCPVCGQGVLDATWRTHVTQLVDAERVEAGKRRLARQAVDTAQRQAVELIHSVPEPVAPDRLGLAALAAARAAWRRWTALANDIETLPAALERTYGELVTTVGTLRDEAAALLTQREDAWAPVAVRLAEWVQLATRAMADEPAADRAERAVKAMATIVGELRESRLTAVEEKARAIWTALKQDSNVELGGIKLEGKGTRRHVELPATVDGAKAEAVAVMSQGELHALALALFIPRATTPASPFRFLVLDDPIQAMDPAKIDGFVRVLTELAEHRQVIVLTHDNRLPQVLRELAVDARIVEVHRGANSVVTIVECEDLAQRYLREAFALVRDEHMPAKVSARILPTLCRMAVEVAARDRYFARQLGAGTPRAAVEETWQGAVRTRAQLALALDQDEGNGLNSWLAGRPHRKIACDLVTKGGHRAVGADPLDAVRQVERLVWELRARNR